MAFAESHARVPVVDPATGAVRSELPSTYPPGTSLVQAPFVRLAGWSGACWASFVALCFLTLVTGLWLFHRSHADLGTNWSITLEVREHHRLVANGVYRRIRHPMYTSLFLYSIGQALALPNWIAGPSYLVAFGILFVFRLRAEERMMLRQFGAEYESYAARTKRLVPGVW